MNEEAIVSELCSLGWSRETLQVWRRAHIHCEYCCKSLLGKIDDYLYGSEIDHVVPGLGDHLDNLALACKTCNFIKRNTSFASEGETLSRADIIAKARAAISAKRKMNDDRLHRVKGLLEQLPKIDG